MNKFVRLALLLGLALAGIPLLHCDVPLDGAAPPSSLRPPVDVGVGDDGSLAPPEIDAAAEDGPPEHCDIPVNLEPPPTGGAPCVPKDGTSCVPDSWFCMSKWSPFYYDGLTYPRVTATFGKREPRVIVRTARFLLDNSPVTNAKYLAYVRATGASPPPDLLDDAFSDVGMEHVDEAQPTGWVRGMPEERRLAHPVVGVTRGEAQAYCEHEGGRLPTIVEILRAGQPELPATYRFPWGARFPFDPLGSMRIAEGFNERALGGAYPLTSAVDTIYGDRGPFGTTGLATNVAEWLATCEEEVREKLMGIGPLVFAPSRVARRCLNAVLTTNLPRFSPDFMGQRILAIQDNPGATETAYLGRRLDATGLRAFDLLLLYKHLPSRPPPADPAGNNVRNFQVSFRCAYDAPR